MRQAQGCNSVDRAEPKMSDDPPSQNQANQNDSIEPGVVAGKPQSERPIVGGPTDAIGSAIRLHRFVKGKSIGQRKVQLGEVKAQKRTKSREGKTSLWIRGTR